MPSRIRKSRLANFGKEQGVVAPDVERTNMALVVANSVGSLHQAEQTIAADQERIRNDKDSNGENARTIAYAASFECLRYLTSATGEPIFSLHKLSERSS